MSAATPGPWTVQRGADASRMVTVPVHPSEGTGFVVAFVNSLPRLSMSVQGDVEANARLIAAAPDLLEALKAEHAKAGFCAEPEICDLARVIAKAEGR